MSDESSASDQVSTVVRCAHEQCQCTFPMGKATRDDDRLFCCGGCAAGTGCNHAECACARAIPLGHSNG